jgi:hypothetical protein
MHPAGYQKASQNLEDALTWAQSYPYSSWKEMNGPKRLISEPEILDEIFTPEEYKEFCRDFIEGRERDWEQLVTFE